MNVSAMIYCLLVVACAGLVMPSPKCPSVYGHASLRAKVPEKTDGPSLDDPTTRELFGAVTRAELSIGLSQIKASLDVLAERQSGELKAFAERQDALAERQDAKLDALAERQDALAERQSGEFKFVATILGIVIGAIYLDLSKEFTELSEEVTQLSSKVNKFGEVATQFDLYKNGANLLIAALVGSVITALVGSVLNTYYTNKNW
eukprot:CAMPEP_0197309446 /NCGR_PEP_ID=MMETSP0891-20130614/8025_1 /TAXON_ID=44058 ORGANISM="Aureoumbra lagunensis, Strain CCMP1510" /NCGR_SAMPLE_ID=MMETSP0891 /ASSEMBLY_ACC=CAM_ASM_000534 /LENGTH=204 /DNA_ID=CAMNT_0042794507 /DNA_START=1349 /DNA_END=1960 /DNA_ORIENTATION=-